MATRGSASIREARLAEVARRYLRGESQVQIALAVGCSTTQIGRDLAAVRRRWATASTRDFQEIRSEQLAKIDELEASYWQGWEASLGERQVSLSEKRSGATDGARVSLRKENRCGNPHFLDGAARMIERRCKLLGLDAPDRHELLLEPEQTMTEDEAKKEIWRLMGSPTPWDLEEQPPLTAENLPPGFQPPPADAPPPKSAFERLFGFPYESVSG